MQLDDFQRRLEKLNSSQLIDVVKNYRQYGYSLPMRQAALTLLDEQGISLADLQLTGQLTNSKYDQAEFQYAAFTKAAQMAFGSYAVLLALYTLAFFNGPLTPVARMALLSGIWLSTALYLLFLVKSFLSQAAFYRATGEAHLADGALTYVFLGMPFYIVMYFVFKKQMTERLKAIQ